VREEGLSEMEALNELLCRTPIFIKSMNSWGVCAKEVTRSVGNLSIVYKLSENFMNQEIGIPLIEEMWKNIGFKSSLIKEKVQDI